MSNERRKPYPFDQIEPKWQARWQELQSFHALNPGEPGFDFRKPKFYVLDMFPYPSGAGLHVGHPEGYTATDILARAKRMQGFNVLHPMGWDAFGLPAEQYAIKTGQHPRTTTEQNVAHFREQLKRIGFAYDWQREVNTTDPKYFKWTQWIFLQLYHSYFDYELNRAQPIALLEDALSDSPKRREEWKDNAYLSGTHAAFLASSGEERTDLRHDFVQRSRLAYVAKAPVNWCPALGTVLANEEVIDGKSEVGGYPVERRPMSQWMLRITAFAQRLIDELEGLDWPEGIKLLQKNWIGRSEGAEVVFKVEHSDCAIPVFTTRPDTLYGATYLVLAPEHHLVDRIAAEEQGAAVREYREKTARKSDLERTDLAKEKSGVFTGAFATNPVNGERIPIWIADYVLAGYGTGAIMAVPAHDERDWIFARTFALPILAVVSPAPQLGPGGERPCSAEPFEYFTGEGYAINSSVLDGLPTAEAKQEIITRLEQSDAGKRTITYKLRDWLFSRQRYWGEPFPIVWEDGRHRALPEHELPLTPPELADFKPTGAGEPPLAKATDWIRYSATATRETNTMPQWAGSCWYYLRFCDPLNEQRFVGTQAEKYWMGGYLPPFPRTPEQWRKDIYSLLDYAHARGSGKRVRLAFGYLGAKQAEQVKAATGLDVRGAFHVIDSYAISHAIKKHGAPAVEDRREQIALTDEDFARLPEVAERPDRIVSVGHTHQGLPVIALVKQMNGCLWVVEEVHASANLLAVVTMWKRKGTASDADIVACSSTSETLRSLEVLAHFGPQRKPELSPPDYRSPEARDSIAVGATPSPGVDLYVGGTEHAVLHLLYARFWHKVLYDLGHVSTPEPFQRLVNQGIILGGDGQKMSKSRGNVVNPDDVIAQYGADAFRCYEMFMGPLEQMKPWSMTGVEGVSRFLARVWRLIMEEDGAGVWMRSPSVQDVTLDKPQLKVVHATIKKVSADIEALSFNTALAQMMIFVNAFTSANPRPLSAMQTLLQLLNPFAPHLTEELWERLGHSTLLAEEPWPSFDERHLIENEIEIPVQVNGKLRDKLVVLKEAPAAEIEAAALACAKVQEHTVGKTIRKVVVVPGKLVNIVVS